MPAADATRPLLELLAATAGEVAVLSDYDGSLAPVVEDPDAAVALPEAIDALKRLVPLVRVVGVVSGRAVDFIASRVAIAGLALAGQHGLEFERSGERALAEAAAAYVGPMEVAASEADARLPGVRVERKGASLTLHWRADPGRANEVQAVAAEVASRHGLALLPGRMIVEIRPPVRADKGTAVEVLAAGCSAVLFAGDDDGDLAAFDALDRLVGAGVLDTAVRVGVWSPEAPPALMARADVVVDGPAGLAALLGGLADLIAAGSTTGGAPQARGEHRA